MALAMNECHILDSIPDLSTCMSFTDRYFSKRYVMNANGVKNNDIMVMFHSNRIALLSLAPTHFLYKNNIEYKINFSSGKVDRLTNTVKGKGKKGGQKLLSNSVVCKIEYEDGTGFDIPSCIKGTLVEINEHLVKNPELLRELPDSKGYIAIILSTIAVSEATKNEMLTHEEYIAI